MQWHGRAPLHRFPPMMRSWSSFSPQLFKVFARRLAAHWHIKMPMEPEIWTFVCWLLADESLEANIHQAGKRVLPWSCLIPVPHGKVQKPLC